MKNTRRTAQKRWQKFTAGFTLVELVVVIVVIGILVGVVIVSYNGVVTSSRIQTAKTDVQTAASTLTRYKADNGAFPSSLSGVTISAVQSTFQYTFNSTNDTYCITATYINQSAFINAGSMTPAQGGCPGHGVNGVPAITNIGMNPSAEADTANVAGYFSSPVSRVAAGDAVSGGWIFSTTTNSTAHGQGLIHTITTTASDNQTYTCSISLRGTAGNVVVVSGRAYTSANGYIGESYGAKNLTLSASWQRLTVTFTTPANTGIVFLQYHLTTATSGITIQSDAILCTLSSNTYNYADGDSANWVWNGTPEDSSSTGPQL